MRISRTRAGIEESTNEATSDLGTVSGMYVSATDHEVLGDDQTDSRALYRFHRLQGTMQGS